MLPFDFRLRRAKLAAPPLSSPPSSPVDFADLRRCTEGVLPTDPGVAAGAIEGVRPIEPGVRSARSDAIVASFVGGEAPSPTGGGEGPSLRIPFEPLSWRSGTAGVDEHDGAPLWPTLDGVEPPWLSRPLTRARGAADSISIAQNVVAKNENFETPSRREPRTLRSEASCRMVRGTR